MEIKDFLDCSNDNILPRESKMIANVILSGNKYQYFLYSDISKIVYETYNIYIKYNIRFDKNVNSKKIPEKLIAPKEVGFYAGEVSWLCNKLNLPLISVKINGKDDMPHNGFYVFPYCKQLLSSGKQKSEIKRIIRAQVSEALENEDYNKLINFVNSNGVVTEKANISNSLTVKVEDEIQLTEGNLCERNVLLQERNQSIIKQVKIRDNYTCRACGFNYENKIVEVHHLKPISLQKEEHNISEDDLITLCPNCHSLSHNLLSIDSKYSQKDLLLDKLKEISQALY